MSSQKDTSKDNGFTEPKRRFDDVQNSRCIKWYTRVSNKIRKGLEDRWNRDIKARIGIT